jgi:hypothetical protein
MYNPFCVSFNDLATHHLLSLKDVEEGWHVEYKETLSDAARVAKSASSFANTYGGWLFYGIRERGKSPSVAGEFTGIPTADIAASLQRIRSSIATSMAPACHYDVKVLEGPDHDTGLDAGRCIVCVYVPQSIAAPHIHRDGRIYRRVGDASEPKPETDRFLLDSLFRRSEAIKEVYLQLFQREPLIHGLVQGAPVIQLFLIADVLRPSAKLLHIDIDEFRKLVNDNDAPVMLPFESVYTSPTGFVARHTSERNFSASIVTWRLSRDLQSEIVIPLRCFDLSEAQLPEPMRAYSHGQNFCALLTTMNCASCPVVDLNSLFPGLLGVLCAWRRVLQAAGRDPSFFVKMRLIVPPNAIPFIDVPYICRYYERHGPPILLDGSYIVRREMSSTTL